MRPAILAWVVAAALPAADWYVATTGDDAAAGTLAAPFGTIAHGIAAVADGDTLWVRGGIYDIVSDIGIWGRHGTATGKRRIAAYPGETPILDGSSRTSGNFLIYVGSNHWIVEGLTLRNNPKGGGLGIWNAGNITFRNNTITTMDGGGISTFSNDPTRATCTDILYEGNVVTDVVRSNRNLDQNGWGSGIGFAMTTRGVMRNNTVRQAYGEGILSYLSDQIAYQGNRIEDTFATGLYIDNGTNCVVERNVVYHSRNSGTYWRNNSDGIGPHNGIQIANEDYTDGGSKPAFSNPSRNNIIRSNVIIRARAGFYYGSYQNGGGLKSSTIANNVFYDSQDSAIHVDKDAHASTVFVNNIAVQTGTAKMGAGLNGTLAECFAGLTLHHNLWYGGAGVFGTPLAGMGDVLADPKFLDAGPTRSASAGYKPGAGSPAIDAGVAIAVITDDITGAARTGTMDLGAFSVVVGSPSVQPRLIITPASVSVPEAGTATVLMRLDARPDGDVMVATARQSGDADLSVSAGSTRTFTTGNWSVDQQVVLAAAADADASDGSAVFSATAPALAAAGSIAAIEDDDDGAAAVLDGSLRVVLAGEAPAGAVAVRVNGFDAVLSAGRWRSEFDLPSGTTAVTVVFVAADASQRQRTFSVQRP